MSPYADDAASSSSSPEPEGDMHDASMNATEAKLERASTADATPPRPSNGAAQPTKANAKDPSRPRRKKARRACFACQRAHLTCGDERPCLRCIKRGLQEHCHDGVRKKAKYLHDAPAEALIPGFANTYHINGSQNLAQLPGMQASPNQNSMLLAQSGNFYPPNAQSSFPQYGPMTQQQSHMGPPAMDKPGMAADFPNHNVDSPVHYQSGSSQQVSPVQEIGNTLEQNTQFRGPSAQTFDPAFLDPNDPSLFNFNISDLNFGNHYGALEFGMLGHMSSAALGGHDMGNFNAMNKPGQPMVPYDNSGGYPGGFEYNQAFPAWQSVPNVPSRHSSSNNMWASPGTGVDAFAIGEQSASMTGASPHSQNQDYSGYQNTMSPDSQFPHSEQNQPHDLLRQSLHQREPRKQGGYSNDSSDAFRKRRRKVSEIYNSVQAPYSYTQGFHALTALLQKRYPPKKVLRIAKALATIRPSFISCNQNLNDDDLIFMEKCFQRTLCEYDDFVNHYATPTIICRRTGEIAAVSKEFSLVTGWRRDVLLGKEPNLNVNTGTQSSESQVGTSNPRGNTRHPNLESDAARPQPVFLAELMDEDSVVQFYEHFAELAFGASRTSIIGAPCSLLKYRTAEDSGWTSNGGNHDNSNKRLNKLGDVKMDPAHRNSAGVVALGEKDGRVECQMCWTVRRDVFDIPMLIVMNFLPII